MTIFTQKLAGWLLMNGCTLKEVKTNRLHPQFFVYIFEQNEKLRQKYAQHIMEQKNIKETETK
jgi:hypothetical protein